MYRVLVPVDRDRDRAESIIETFTSIPWADGAVEAVVLSVFEEIDVAEDIGGGAHTEELFEDVEPPATLGLVADALEDAGYPTSVRRLHGDPASLIADVAEDGFDHIVMSGQKRTPVGKLIFGSVAQSVILNTSVPVTVTMTR